MRVLVLSYETPAYPGAGGPSRAHCLLEPLAERHSIHVLSTAPPPPFGRPPRGVDIRFLDPGDEPTHPTEPWLRKNVVHYLTGRPWLHHLASHHARALREALPEAISKVEPDLVQIEHGELAALLQDVPREVPRILVLHNLLSDVQRQNVRGNGGWAAFKALLEVGLCLRQERRDGRAASRVVAVTEHDARRLRRVIPSAKVDVVPNCVNLGYWDRCATPFAERPTAVMTASFHYPPNRRAALELLSTVWPLVRRRVPDAQLRLVGQRMPDDLRGMCAVADGTVAVGEVDDVRTELHPAWVSLAPLRQGSGSPLKVMEALAASTPVVATRRVARAVGLGAQAGVLCADTAEEFADVCAELLLDPARCRRLGRDGAVAARRFDREPAARMLEKSWHDAVAVEYAELS